MSEIIDFGSLQLRFLQSGQDTQASLNLFEMLLRPGGRMPVPHYHENWDETVYGLDGVSTWRIAGRDVEVLPGGTVFIPRGAVHGFDNRTAAEARCLCVLTPGVLDPAYFRDMAALISKGSPDPATMRETMMRHGLIPSRSPDRGSRVPDP